MLDCKNITSLRRTLSGGAKLLMGDQVLSGCAVKVSNTFTKGTVTEEEEKQNKAVAEIFDISQDQVDMDPIVVTPVGTKLYAPYLSETNTPLKPPPNIVIAASLLRFGLILKSVKIVLVATHNQQRLPLLKGDVSSA